MRMGRLALFALAACLGAAAVVLPAVAGSETGPTVEAVNSNGVYGEQHHSWMPSQVTVTSGGVVTIQNSSATVPHGVEWVGGAPTPSCNGVPGASSGQPRSGTSWSGTCTFSQPGTYTFYCTVHGAEMTGTVTVNANGTITMTTSTGTSETGSAPAGVSPQAPAAPGPQLQASSPLAGAASEALKLAARQRGAAVRGAIAISQAGAGGRLEVDLLASSASLASAGRVAQVRVGKLVRAHLAAGKTTFAVPLTARGRRALHRHGRLRLSVKVVVTPPSGSATTIIRRVAIRP
jgi:plastocyanin